MKAPRCWVLEPAWCMAHMGCLTQAVCHLIPMAAACRSRGHSHHGLVQDLVPGVALVTEILLQLAARGARQCPIY